ncbi:amidohydrolase family protein [Jiangella anatolica]|uniref:Metal-dependent hydrolase n=1 Tax=Jiangella anatolica TaxID=2670374 RepID=A0A2W2C2P8_9ACTN|nr:amidohydrolase family protein [Jiangella anatolica]PZF80036.1 metal-dependent hydrolase [Jiangella anatolica]
MIVDIHGHLGSPGDFFVPEPSAQWLLRMADRVGIDAIGVSHFVALNLDARRGNTMAIDLATQYPGRLGAWLVANPHDRDGDRVIADQLDVPGVWGLKVHPDFHSVPVLDRRYERYLRLAADHSVPVLSHGQTRSDYSDPADLAEVARRHPGLTLLVGHAGLWTDGFARAAELAAAQPGLHLEIAGSRLTTRWLERMVAIAGADKVLFGTDANFLDPRVGLGKVVHSRLADADRELVLGGNAVRLLGRRLPPHRQPSREQDLLGRRG